MNDEQRRLFRETQAVMSLLEGFSDFVMDEVGRDLVPDVERISERFHARREQKKTGVERAIMRLTGMDLKIEQYRKGERFVAAIARPGGPAALERSSGTAPRACPATARSRRPSAGWPGWWRLEATTLDRREPGRRPGSRAAAGSRRRSR